MMPTEIMLIQQISVVCCNYCKTFDQGHETRQCQLVLCMQFNWIKPQGGMLKRFDALLHYRTAKYITQNKFQRMRSLNRLLSQSEFHTNLRKMAK